MRTAARSVVIATLALALLATLAIPASAARLIRYRGETSTPKENAVSIDVLKKDNGQRVLKLVAVDFILECENGTTELQSHIIFPYRAERLVEDDGTFALESNDPADYFRFEGHIGFRHAEGTFEVDAARLTDDHQDTTFCTTGPLTWTAERRGSVSARTTLGHR